METILFFIILAFLITALPNQKRFSKSDHASPGGHDFAEPLMANATNGEFLIADHLEKIDGPNRLLPNLHLPKSDGTMTEIGLVMIARTGIYVFETRDYNGCVCGDEDSRYWTQSMKRGHKVEFYNPIWQNESHISMLNRLLAIENDAFKSYVVFSDCCTLKKMSVLSGHVKVMNCDCLMREIIKDMAELPDIFTPIEIDQIYSELLPFARTAAAIGQAQIESVRWK